MPGYMPEDGDPEAHQPTYTPGRPAPASRGSLSFDVAWIGVGGIGLYVLLRLPFTFFYSLLGTTPEEVGLTYTQTLAQSSGAVILVLGSAALSSLIFLAYIRNTVRGTMVGRGPKVSRWYLAGLNDHSYEEHLKKVEEYWSCSPPDLAGFTREMPLRSQLRDFDKIKKPNSGQRAEARAILRELASGDHFTKRPVVFLAATGVYFALVLMGLGPQLALAEANSLQHCKEAQFFPGFRFAGPHVQLLSADEKTDAFADRHLFLLSGDSNRYILYDCRTQATLRVPASNYIVINSNGQT